MYCEVLKKIIMGQNGKYDQLITFLNRLTTILMILSNFSNP